jgi:16S rRNA (uracil1498-N3)-methyltransferase
MHRFFLPPGSVTGDRVRLSDGDAVHAARVLRLQPGDPVVILDGIGGEFGGEVSTVDRREVTVAIRRRQQHPTRAATVTLIQAIAKTKAMDGLLQKAVELGVSRVVPLTASHCISQPDDSGDKRDKWQAIAVESAKQCGNPWLMKIDDPVSPQKWIDRREPFDLLLIGSLLDPPRSFRAVFEEFRGAHGRNPASVGILIGPEGDFSPAEYEAFRAAGAKSITLGPLILRVETAVAASVAVIQHELAAGG